MKEIKVKPIKIKDLDETDGCKYVCVVEDCINDAGFLLKLNICNDIYSTSDYPICPDCLAKIGIKVIKALR